MIDRGKLVRWYDFQAPFYRLWRDDYDGPLVRAVSACLGASPAPRRILDAGCGTGIMSIGLGLTDDRLEIEGLDASKGMLEVARKQAARRGLSRLTFRVGDATELPFEGASFDAVVAAGLMPCIEPPRQALQEFHRVLKPAGQLVSVEFDRISMSFATRVFFRVMIAGYRLVSYVRPEFRYAEGWNIDCSTLDLGFYEKELRDSGFEILSRSREASHVVYHARRA